MQFATFYVSDSLYGVMVDHVHEITRLLPVTPVPLAPSFVHGLINLRGTIVTAVHMRSLFSLPQEDQSSDQQMTVICKIDSILVALLVDAIGDVMTIDEGAFESVPVTMRDAEYVKHVCQLPHSLLGILDIEKIATVIQKINH